MHRSNGRGSRRQPLRALRPALASRGATAILARQRSSRRPAPPSSCSGATSTSACTHFRHDPGTRGVIIRQGIFTAGTPAQQAPPRQRHHTARRAPKLPKCCANMLHRVVVALPTGVRSGRLRSEGGEDVLALVVVPRPVHAVVVVVVLVIGRVQRAFDRRDDRRPDDLVGGRARARARLRVGTRARVRVRVGVGVGVRVRFGVGVGLRVGLRVRGRPCPRASGSRPSGRRRGRAPD